MRSHGRRTQSVEDRTNQWFNNQELASQDRIVQLGAYLKKDRADLAALPEGHKDRGVLQEVISKREAEIQEVVAQSEALQAQREDAVKAESEYQKSMAKYGVDSIKAQGVNRSLDFARQQRQMTSGRFTQRTMLGRELEYIRSSRETAQKQINQLTPLEGKQKAEVALAEQRLQEAKANNGDVEGAQAKLDQAKASLENTQQALRDNQQIVSQFPSSLDGLSAAFNATASIGLSFATRLATQVFRKVKQFDAQMTQIQMVTLKSDAQMSTLGDGFIQKAIDLKASIADVTTAATALYRQGLDDQEVDNRLGDIMKFTKIGNVKAADATKLATVAVNGGMVSSAQQAFDAVAAISDNAATDAAAITKGLQKSMYAAKSVGVSFNELVSMLAVITSKTQLSGQVAGTTMATVFSRLSRMRENQVVYDENGNATSASDVSVALHHAGVELYENGEMRSAFDVISDLGKVWEGLGDTQKASISYLLGAGRQASNLQALMEGFAEVDENGRSLIDTFVSLADASGGIVDEKYTVYAESLAAAMTNIKNSFDELVGSIAQTGAITDLANGFAALLQSLAGFASIGDGVVGQIMGIAGAAAVIAPVLMKLWPLIAAIGPGLLAAGAFGAAAVGIGSAVNAYNTSQRYNSYESVSARGYSAIDRRIEKANTSYENASSLVSKF